MKIRILIFILFIFPFKGNSQILDLCSDSLLKIVFIDHQNNNFRSSYGTVYELEPIDTNFKLFQTKKYFKNVWQKHLDKYNLSPSDEKVFLKEMRNEDIVNLTKAINNKKFKTIQLEEFGYTEIYLKENANSIAKKYRHYDSLTNRQQEYFVEQIQDYKKVKNVLPHCLKVYRTSDYPTCAIQFIYPADTIHIYSSKQNPYMTPWNLNNISESYNPEISRFFASIIPNDNFSNKGRLEGKELLEQDIAEKVYRWYCETRVKINELEDLLVKEIDLIHQHFEIRDAEIGSIGSIDWDYFKQGDCWTANLHDKNVSKNIIFSVTMEKRGKPGSIKPLIEQKASILKRLNKVTFLIEHIKNNPRRKLEIHFTKDKSFSKRAQKSFLEDLPTEHKTNFEPVLDKMILMTLSNENGWSRWLILPNGQTMLWHYSGKPPINEYTEEQLRIHGGSFKNSCKLFSIEGNLTN